MTMRDAFGKKRRAIKAALHALHSSPELLVTEGIRTRSDSDGSSTFNPKPVDMKTKKVIRRVTIENERTFIFRNRAEKLRSWCAECGAEVEMASVEAAAHEVGVSEMLLYQSVDSGALHFTETPDGRVLICLSSLLQQAWG